VGVKRLDSFQMLTLSPPTAPSCLTREEAKSLFFCSHYATSAKPYSKYLPDISDKRHMKTNQLWWI